MLYLVACHCPANALLLNSDMIQVKLDSSGKPQHVEMKQEFIMTKIRSFYVYMVVHSNIRFC